MCVCVFETKDAHGDSNTHTHTHTHLHTHRQTHTHTTYKANLKRACGAGDGWSPRAEDAVLHGCIPVVIMDNVDPVFGNVLEWAKFSVRIAEVHPLPPLPPNNAT